MYRNIDFKIFLKIFLLDATIAYIIERKNKENDRGQQQDRGSKNKYSDDQY